MTTAMPDNALPFVSVIIPCYNEERFIGQCLDSIVANDYPSDKLEVLVIDGMSVDNTRIVVEEYMRNYSFIRLLDNPDRITPRALNIGILSSNGDIVIRMDAHAVYDRCYISKSVQYLKEYGADNVGGVMQTVPRENSVIGKAISGVMSSRFGVGNSMFRVGANTIQEVETVFGGCYPRRIFDQIGLFDERFHRGQDREFNFRLRKNGGKILLAPDIRCKYYARSDPLDHLKHMFASGNVVFTLSRVTGTRIYSNRNLVPLIFVIALMGLLILSLLHPLYLKLFFAIILVYLIVAFLVSTAFVRAKEDTPLIFVMPLLFVLTHTAYGVGSLVGLFKPIRRQSIWSKV